jgi:hypothetical protein
LQSPKGNLQLLLILGGFKRELLLQVRHGQCRFGLQLIQQVGN